MPVILPNILISAVAVVPLVRLDQYGRTQMTYIELINRFWQLDEQHAFSGDETRLYFYLLKVANASVPAWPEQFERADNKVAADNNIKSVNTMKKHRERLREIGLIDFETGGKGQGNRTRYQIRYQNLTPKLTPKPADRYQNLIPNLTPNDALVSSKVSKFDTYSIYKRLKTFYSLSKGSVRKKMSRFLRLKKQKRKPPRIPRIPPKPPARIIPLRSDPFTIKSESELLNVPFSDWYPTYQLNIAETQCRRLWLELTPEERLKAQQHTPLYVASTPNKRFRKAPTNYLEEKTFNDEIINRNETNTKSATHGASGAGGRREIIRTQYTPQKFKRSGGTGKPDA